MAKYGKSYPTIEEYIKRRENFAQQVQVVSELNSKNGVSYTVGFNQFSDLSNEEFEARYLGDNGAPEE